MLTGLYMNFLCENDFLFITELNSNLNIQLIWIIRWNFKTRRLLFHLVFVLLIFFYISELTVSN